MPTDQIHDVSLDERSSPEGMLDFWSLGRWFEPTQGHVSSLISPHCPLRLLGQV